MKVTGYYDNAHLSLTGELMLTLSINEKTGAIDQINNFSKDTLYDIEIKPHTRKRSLDANALLWACIGEIAKTISADKWEVYLTMLKRYGKFTYIVVRENVVEAMKKQWRECEVLGDININGQKGVQLLCYFGSSSYDTKEFSCLLEGVISEMEEMGLQPPLPKSVQNSLALWEKQHKQGGSDGT